MLVVRLEIAAPGGNHELRCRLSDYGEPILFPRDTLGSARLNEKAPSLRTMATGSEERPVSGGQWVVSSRL